LITNIVDRLGNDLTYIKQEESIYDVVKSLENTSGLSIKADSERDQYGLIYYKDKT
jgi:hypothetical protein